MEKRTVGIFGIDCSFKVRRIPFAPTRLSGSSIERGKWDARHGRRQCQSTCCDGVFGVGGIHLSSKVEFWVIKKRSSLNSLSGRFLLLVFARTLLASPIGGIWKDYLLLDIGLWRLTSDLPGTMLNLAKLEERKKVEMPRRMKSQSRDIVMDAGQSTVDKSYKDSWADDLGNKGPNILAALVGTFEHRAQRRLNNKQEVRPTSSCVKMMR